MKNPRPKDGETGRKGGKFEAWQSGDSSVIKKKKSKNMKRLGGGGGGLSLEAFANMKSNRSGYNPALIKKQREFYKNAKYVSKYKKTLKQTNQHNDASAAKSLEDTNEQGDHSKTNKRNNSKRGPHNLEFIYEKKREEEERARMEKEAIIQAKKEEREKAEARRKADRKKMFKKTRSGQPVMKYRIEHLLQTIQSQHDTSGGQ